MRTPAGVRAATLAPEHHCLAAEAAAAGDRLAELMEDAVRRRDDGVPTGPLPAVRGRSPPRSWATAL